jgi:hypothetical protein
MLRFEKWSTQVFVGIKIRSRLDKPGAPRPAAIYDFRDIDQNYRHNSIALEVQCRLVQFAW